MSEKSLLSWERGLKFVLIYNQVNIIESLLSWERGLKSYEPLASLSQVVSLLSWERGLKSYEPLASLSQVVSLLSWERGLKYQHMNLYTIIICCVIVELVVKSIFIAITRLINNTSDNIVAN